MSNVEEIQRKLEAENLRRKQIAERIWRSVEYPDILQRDFGFAMDLFREALLCYMAHADNATVLMCRTSAQTAIYTTIARKRTRAEGRLLVDFDYIHANWDLIVCKAKEKRRITKDVETMLRPITRHGNYVAHMGQKFDQRAKEFRKGNIGLGDTWIRPSVAVGILRQTAAVLNRIRQFFSA